MKKDEDINDYINDCIQIYFRDVKRAVLSEKEREELLLKGKNGDIEARNKFINSNLLFVSMIAERYKNKGIDYEDLIQEGSLGLFKAFDKFDINCGTKFLTYVAYWIHQTMLRAIHNDGKTVRIPVCQCEKIDKIKRAKKSEYSKNGKDISYEKISELTNISEEEVLEAINTNPLLSDREKQVIKYRFGLGCPIMSQPEIGKIYGVSRQAINVNEKTALKKLQKSKKFNNLKNFI